MRYLIYQRNNFRCNVLNTTAIPWENFHTIWHRSVIPVCHTHYDTGRVYRYVTPTMTQVGYTGMSHPLWHRSGIPVCHTHYDTGQVYRCVIPNMTQVGYTGMSHPFWHRSGILVCHTHFDRGRYTCMSHPLWHRSGIPVCPTKHYDTGQVYRYVTPPMT